MFQIGDIVDIPDCNMYGGKIISFYCGTRCEIAFPDGSLALIDKNLTTLVPSKLARAPDMPKCECGAHRVKDSCHAYWCDLSKV
jgi:hypothetical protein